MQLLMFLLFLEHQVDLHEVILQVLLLLLVQEVTQDLVLVEILVFMQDLVLI